MVVSISKKLRVKNIIFGILLFSLLTGGIFALKDLIPIDGGLIGLINQKYRGYKVNGSVLSAVINTGQYGSTITNRLFSQVKEFDICKVVSTTSTSPLFIPTKTFTEWSGFINKKPSTVTLASCGCYVDGDCDIGETCAGVGLSTSSYCDGTYTSTSNYCKKNSNGFGCRVNGVAHVGSTYLDCSTYGGVFGFYFDSTFYNVLTACTYYIDNPDYWYNCAPCASVTNATECGQKSNLCTWISGGTSSSCSAFDTNQVSCQGTAGCTWHPAEPATPGVCEILDYPIDPVDPIVDPIVDPPSTCFVAGTQVKIADGINKNIENIEIGDQLLGQDDQINTVIAYDRPNLGERKLYSINNGPYFVTHEHPFMTIGGWKSISPEATRREMPNFEILPLKVGDILVKENDEFEYIWNIQSTIADPETSLYNFKLNGNQTYYADGYLVHNKSQCLSNSDCSYVGIGSCCNNGTCTQLVNGVRPNCN